MNSLVSYDWLNEYVNLKGVTPDEFARRVSLSGPGVEKIYPQGADLDKVIVGHVKEVLAHPNADKLRIAVVNVGARHAVPLRIVCGGSNLKVDQWVAVALVGASVKWHGQGEPIILEPIEIRGVKSDGMICAAEEIGLGEAFKKVEEREILDLGKEFPEMKLKPGTPLADMLGLSDDVVMDIEVTTNRVDAMGMVGMAREAAAILDKPFVWEPQSVKSIKSVKSVKSDTPKVKVTAKKACARFMAAKIEGVTVGPSPWWMKRRLLSAGINPISNVVDISNYVMLELAQPMHVYDAKQLSGGLDVRFARAGETIKLLDGRTSQLDDTVLVIADAKAPVGVAGVMGGEGSSVQANTTDVLIEVANFDPVIIRRGARKLNLQTDAQQRFEKGLSSEAPPIAMARAIELILELCGGKLVGSVADVQQAKYVAKKFSITTDEANTLLGVPMSQKEMVAILRRLGFEVKTVGKKMTATVPWWRDHDIEDGRDLVEEIARVKGYANIPAIVPVGIATRSADPRVVWEKRVKDFAAASGLTEVYSYSFISEELAGRAGFDPAKMLHVQNPLSSDFVAMRTTLMPSLLDVASENRERARELRLFEVAMTYLPNGSDWKNLPDEQLEFSALFTGMKEPWRVAKGCTESLLALMGFEDVSWRRLSSDTFWHPGRTVQAFHRGELLATVGEISPNVADAFKLDGPVAMINIPFAKLVPLAKSHKTYTAMSPFPEAKRDLAIMVDHRVEYEEIATTIKRVDPLISSVEWFDTYMGKNLPAGKKSVAMHLTMSASDRTLESTEVDALLEKAMLALKEHHQAELRG